MFVETILLAARKRLVTIDDGASLVEAAKLLADRDTDLVVACGSNKFLSGVITKTDVVRQMSHCQGSCLGTAVSAVMTRNVFLGRPDDQLRDVWSIMKKRGLKNIPIVDPQSRAIGVLNARDVLSALLGEAEHEEDILRDYVMSVGYR